METTNTIGDFQVTTMDVNCLDEMENDVEMALEDEPKCETLTDQRLKNLNERLEAIEKLVMNTESKNGKKEKLTESCLQELIENAIRDGGQYGSSRNYIRKYLAEKHGLIVNEYMRARVNRILRKLCDLKRVERNCDLFGLVKE